MAHSVEIIPAAPMHIPAIAENMRKADVKELMASCGEQPAEALARSLDVSALAWTVTIDGKPSLMFGAAPLCTLTGTGTPWLLATDDIAKIRRRFIKQSDYYVQVMLRQYPRLVNFVHSDNKLSQRWLRWLRFTLHPAIPFGVAGEMFHPFELRRDYV